MREIHYSEVGTFLRCRRQHFYRYVLGLVPRLQHERLDLGTAGHKTIEAILLGKTDQEARMAAINFLCDKVEAAGPMAPFSVEQAAEVAGGIADMAINGIRALGPIKPVMHHGKPLVEETIKVEVARDVLLRGTADEVLEWPDGLRLVVDNKFRAGFRPFSTEPLNLQMGTYQCLLLRSGVKTHGSLQLQINRNFPRVPKVNQDGTVSRAAVATTWEVYAETVRAAGGNPADYLDMQPKLKYRAVDASVRAYRSERELQRLWETVLVPACLAIDQAYRDFGTKEGERCFAHEICSSCEMRELCVEDLKGGDSEYVKIANYRHKDEPVGQLPPTIDFEEDDDVGF